MQTEIYLQGGIIQEADVPYLTFRVTAVALKDMRMQKLRRKFTKSKPWHISEGQAYQLFPKKHFLNKYILLDEHENILGVLVKSSIHTGWWLYRRFDIKYK